MPTVRYRGDYSFTHNEHGELEEGDVVDIGDYTFEQFGRMFVRVGDETDDDSESENGESAAFDAESFVDRTPMSDVIEDIESGDYDEHLDAIRSAEAADRDRQGVHDALDDLDAVVG